MSWSSARCSTLRFVAPNSEKGGGPVTPGEAAPLRTARQRGPPAAAHLAGQLMAVPPAASQLHQRRTKNHSRESNLLVPEE